MMSLYIRLVLMGAVCQVAAGDKISGFTQYDGLRTACVGETVTLSCSLQENSVKYLSWYQQSLGGKPAVISTQMGQNKEASISPAFKGRFRVIAGGGKNNLIITNLQSSDSATYYCGTSVFDGIEFQQGFFLHVKTSSSDQQTVIQQSTLERVHSGDSVSLSCTVTPEPCAGEQHFYWFRHGAGQPAIIYPSTGLCLNDPESRLKSCTLNLTVNSVSSSDAGMYYCAMAACGETVFGHGTRVEVTVKASMLLVFCLSAALAVVFIVLLVLIYMTYKLKNKQCSVCKGTVGHRSDCSASDTLGQNEGDLHYAALRVNRTSEQRQQEWSSEIACVYSGVKSRRK